MAEVSFQHVCKSYPAKGGPVHAVDDLTFCVDEGTFFVIVGPSGCGKTTTLRLLAGLERPTAGSILIGARKVDDVSPKDRNVAMVFQDHALFPHMTVYKNMAFGLTARQVAKDEIRRRVGEVADTLGLASLLDRKPGSLSGGECQRVALGRAIVRQPMVYLFDEPLSNLDAGLRLSMRAGIRRVTSRSGTTAFYVTHDQEEAMALADRVAVLREGVIQQIGTPLELYDRPANRFVAGFFGSPPMNFLRGRLERSDSAVHFLCGSGRMDLPGTEAQKWKPLCGEEVVLGIRPEHLLTISPGAEPGAGRRDGGASRLARIGTMFVRFIETLGDRLHVHLAADSAETVIARLARTEQTVRGGTVDVFVDLSCVHVFQTANGEKRVEPHSD